VVSPHVCDWFLVRAESVSMALPFLLILIGFWLLRRGK
jgi:hypothetical protein